jgi:hypothetical protein
MENYWEVSEIKWNVIIHALKTDACNDLIPRVDVAFVNCVIRIYKNTDEEYFSEPLLFHAFSFNAKKCSAWLLDHGADINVLGIDRRTILMDACFEWRDTSMIIEAGADVNIPVKYWESRWYNLLTQRECAMMSRMFLLGLHLPPCPSIPRACWSVYFIILERESACRRACYAVLLYFHLPKALLRWMLTSYVLPSKRESCWSPLNIKMPPGFEVLD